MTNQTKTERNGIDVEALEGIIEAVRENPELSPAKFRATNQWKGKALNETTIGDFFVAGEEHKHKTTLRYQNDEAEVLLGDDSVGNPVEYILHALAGCVTTTTVYYAAISGIHLKSIETTLEGDLDVRGFLGISDEVPVGYKNIRVRMKIDSDVSAEKKEALENFYKKSPVFRTLTEGAKIDINVAAK